VAEISAKICTQFLWGLWEGCSQAGASIGVHTDWSFDVTFNQSDCDDGVQGSGSLDRLYVKFTASRDGEEDVEEYDIYP